MEEQPPQQTAALVYDFDVRLLTNGQRGRLYNTLLQIIRGRGWRRHQYSFYLHNNRTRAQIQVDTLVAIVASPEHANRLQSLDVFHYDPARADWTAFAQGHVADPPA